MRQCAQQSVLEPKQEGESCLPYRFSPNRIRGPQHRGEIDERTQFTQLRRARKYRKNLPEISPWSAKTACDENFDDQMNENDDEIAHPGMVPNPKKPAIFGPIRNSPWTRSQQETMWSRGKGTGNSSFIIRKTTPRHSSVCCPPVRARMRPVTNG